MGAISKGSEKGGPEGSWRLAFFAFVLFLVWSNSFVAIGFLLGRESSAARFDWLALTVARFVPAALFAGGYCVLRRRSECLAILRYHWRRLLLCGFLSVPGYNFSLYFGQQHGVPAPVASLTTTLAPLFLIIFGAVFLSERLTLRKLVGFLVAFAGVFLISQAKDSGESVSYSLLLLITAAAPLSWSLFSILSKPVSGSCDPVLWTYLSIVVGTLPLLAVFPFSGGPELMKLDPVGWFSVLYLSLACTVLGFSLWVYLLKHLPASTVGLTVFLNPPLTTASKWLLALVLPAAFTFEILTLEWMGGCVVLIGIGVALLGRSREPGKALLEAEEGP